MKLFKKNRSVPKDPVVFSISSLLDGSENNCSDENMNDQVQEILEVITKYINDERQCGIEI